jgi:hypothetical protein
VLPLGSRRHSKQKPRPGLEAPAGAKLWSPLAPPIQAERSPAESDGRTQALEDLAVELYALVRRTRSHAAPPREILDQNQRKNSIGLVFEGRLERPFTASVYEYELSGKRVQEEGLAVRGCR